MMAGLSGFTSLSSREFEPEFEALSGSNDEPPEASVISKLHYRPAQLGMHNAVDKAFLSAS